MYPLKQLAHYFDFDLRRTVDEAVVLSAFSLSELSFGGSMADPIPNKAEGITEDKEEVETPEVFTVTWMPDDHISELTYILQGAPADRVEKVLVHYVEGSIEPAGWQAIWSVSARQTNCFLNLDHSADILVDVVNVSHEKLLADVTILDLVKPSDNEHDQQVIKEAKGTVISIPLMQLYPIADQENSLIDINTTTEVVEQVRFFYEYIWRAWDLEEENICYTSSLVAARFKLYQDIENGIIPKAVASELRSLVKKALLVRQEIERVEALTEGEDPDSDVDQRDVIQLIKLHQQMEKLRSRYDSLQDPVLRMLSRDQQDIEWLECHGRRKNGSPIKIVVDSLTCCELAHEMTKLPDLIKSLKKVPEETACQSFPTLQLALDESMKGDIIVLCNGTHSLQHLGLMSYGGIIAGLGDNVAIEGSESTGDVLIDANGDLVLQNLIIRPSEGQVGIAHHEGNLKLRDIRIEGGKDGVLGIGSTEYVIERTIVHGCNNVGMVFRESTCVSLLDCTVTKCDVGLQFEEQAKVSLTRTSIKENSNYGIHVVWPEGSNISKFDTIPKTELLQCLLQESEENVIENNGTNISVMTAKGRSDNPASPSHFTAFRHHRSRGSMDSGCDFLDNGN
ncbi:protein nessun dorma-like [Penaeus japonicus]|uniref:protein nessun dorma-like n=1 Tax=Penaeus japonicus TaxID=27405 RepID=UPI001C7117C4|nr:protein nessun dorma-like [Penaeus japonicus]